MVIIAFFFPQAIHAAKVASIENMGFCHKFSGFKQIKFDNITDRVLFLLPLTENRHVDRCLLFIVDVFVAFAVAIATFTASSSKEKICSQKKERHTEQTMECSSSEHIHSKTNTHSH